MSQLYSRMDNELNRAFQLVSQPDNSRIKEGEIILGSIKKQIMYPLSLLQFMNNASAGAEGHLRAAIELRIWCQNYNHMEEYEQRVYSDIMDTLKRDILIMFLESPLKISKTLRPGIVCIADVDFPDRWPTLLPTLLQQAQENPRSITAMLKLIQSISHKYSYLSRSDPLYHEIIIMCDTVHDFLLSLTVNLLQSLQDPPDDSSVKMLALLMSVFYNLNYQDLHPKFEDNLANWMQILKQIMSLKNTSESVFKCKGAALESILLYASKYKEDVEETIKSFCGEIWQLCASATQDPQYDKIVFSSLKFFKSLVLWSDMKDFFTQNMDQLMVNLVLPHVGVTKQTLALFSEEIGVYIDYYFRNTELQTRRAAALELMRVICRNYHTFEPFLTTQISNYLQMVDKNINSQCTILNLIIDGCCKGFRDVDGCTSLFVSEQIVLVAYKSIVKPALAEFYEWILNNPNQAVQTLYSLMHIVTVLRFLFYFRIYLPADQLVLVVQFICSLRTDCDSLKSVLYLTLNGFLSIRHGDYAMYRNLVPYFNPSNLPSIAENVLGLILSADKTETFINEHLSKMLYNLLRGLEQANSQFSDISQKVIRNMLKKTSQFDFTSVLQLFQAIAVLSYWLIRNRDPKQSALEADMLAFFKVTLNTHSDLSNFCFQIFCLFICLNSNPAQHYIQIYESILDPNNWCEDNSSMMSAYVQYLTTFLLAVPDRITSDKPSFQIILSKLILLEHFQLVYRFLEAVAKIIGLEYFFSGGYMQLAVQGSAAIMNTTILARKTALLFFCRLATNYDAKLVVNYANSIHSSFIETLLSMSKDIIQTMQARRDRKEMFSAVCNAIVAGCFANPEVDCTMLDLLIDNTANRFNFTRMAENNREYQLKEKKEATYKKLSVFREKDLDTTDKEPEVDEEIMLVRTYIYCAQNNQAALECISQKNVERIKRLHDKHEKARE